MTNADIALYAVGTLVPILIVAAAIAIDAILSREPAAAEPRREQTPSIALANPGR
jgi:hypothetical protein